MTQQRPESKELSMLIKLLKMTTSTHDHEALSAMRLANLQLLKLGTDWEDLLNAKVTLIADPFSAIPDIEVKTPTSAPPQGWAPSTPRSPPQAPPKPAPPVYYSDMFLIQPHFDNLMFATLPPHVAQRYQALEAAWVKNKRLDAPDWSELQGLSRSWGSGKPRRKRRT